MTLTSQVSESTPPIAAILCLLLLVAAGAVLNKAAARLDAAGSRSALSRVLRWLAFSRGEVLVVFVFLAITAAMPGVGLFRQVMPCIMVPQYFGTATDHLTEMGSLIPEQMAVTDPEQSRVFWEGGESKPPNFGLQKIPVIGPPVEAIARFVAAPKVVPWRQWRGPFTWWSVYLSAYFVAAFCLIALFRRKWEEDEHLTFPISELPVEMIRSESGLVSGVAFFRDPIVWVGLLLAVVYNGLNALHVFNPAVPALGISYPLGSLFTESPWDEMRGLAIYYKPEILGLGYLVPSDVLFSIWFFAILGWIVRPVAFVAGYTPAGFPFVTHQAMGAFLLLGVHFLYQGRKRLAEAVKKAVSGVGADDRSEPLSSRWALIGAVVGLLIVFGMPIVSGVVWWVSLMYFGIMMLVMIVYCRNRAEMGFPIVWGYPLYQQRELMVNFLGSAPLVSAGSMQSLTILTMFSWMQRSLSQAIVATGQEAHVSAHRLDLSRRTVARVVVAALVVGVVTMFLINLTTYYEYGGLVLSSPGGIEGGQMTQEVLRQYQSVSGWVDQAVPPDVQKIVYTLLGSALALGMVLARRAWLRFPFHPGGYALAYCHQGMYPWFAAFVLWVVKTITLRLGGIRAYRRAARGFLAFTLGHFLSVGIWSLVGLYAGEWVRRYIVWFL